MNVRITPGKLRGNVDAVSSKYDLHRLAICAALSDAPTRIRCGALSADIEATLDCLKSLGAFWSKTPDGVSITPVRESLARAELRCGESGSTLRFLLPVAAALTEEASFFGGAELPNRPLEPLLRAMRSGGCACAVPDRKGAGTPIITVAGKLQSGRFTLPGDVSSQFVSGLLFALPLLSGDSEIILTTSLESAGYARMTAETLHRFGVKIEWTQAQRLLIPGGQSYRSPGEVAAQGDWASAAFWLAANFLGSDIRVSGLSEDVIQVDKAIVPLLERLRRFSSETVEIDASQIPDLVPVLAAAAAAEPVDARIFGAARLRAKESDRLKAIATNLRALGGDVAETMDGLIIHGKYGLDGGVVDGWNDHRIVMACAIAGTACRGALTIRGAQAVRKSYPAFFEDFARLGGEYRVV